MDQRSLFISHASEDSAVVQRIVTYLEGQGITCWIAGRDIPPKAIYAEAITDAVKNAQACGVIVSRAANASAAIKRELELASRCERPFIPIRVDDVEPGPGLDYYLNNVQWMEFKREGEGALDRIVAHMRGQRYVAPPLARKRGSAAALMGLAAIGILGAGAGGYFFFGRSEPGAPEALEASRATTANSDSTSALPEVASPITAAPPAAPAPQPVSSAAAMQVINNVTQREWMTHQTLYRTYFSEVPLGSMRAAADTGDPRAQFMLGLIYQFSLGGVEPNITRAIALYRRAAEQGFAPAEGALAYVYQEGAGVPQDTAQLLHWQRRAAEGGYAVSQAGLAGNYYCGVHGLPRDRDAARDWYQRAADQGYGPARDALAQFNDLFCG